MPRYGFASGREEGENAAMAKLPVISVDQMRQWEKVSWAAGAREAEVIERVGRAAAQRLLELTREGDAVWVLAGKGHNGDDARAMAARLHGRKVVLTEVTNPRATLATFPKDTAWIVDGLFGIGLNGALGAEWKELFDAIERSNVPVLALDVPSGLNADTGQAEGPAIKAALTLTVGAPKRGLLRASEWTGRLEVAADVGLIPCPVASELNWTLASDFIGWPPRRKVESNKGSFGHAAIIAGSLGYHGAAVLASRGALRAHPGLVTAYPQEAVYQPVAAQLQAAMVHPWRARTELPKTCSVLLVGCGLAGETAPELPDEVRELWRGSPLAMVVDASALEWLPEGPTPAGAPRVITPHPGEAGRLLKSSAATVQQNRLGALRALSKRWGDCVVVLKGNQTLVGQSAGDVFVNSSGDPNLAQGGTGDLLAGYLTGLMAQEAWRANPVLAARFAAWQHGAAADALSARGLNWTLAELEEALGGIAVSKQKIQE